MINAENEAAGVEWSLDLNRILDPFIFVAASSEVQSRLGKICAFYGLELPEEAAHSADADSSDRIIGYRYGMGCYALILSSLLQNKLASNKWRLMYKDGVKSSTKIVKTETLHCKWCIQGKVHR